LDSDYVFLSWINHLAGIYNYDGFITGFSVILFETYQYIFQLKINMKDSEKNKCESSCFSISMCYTGEVITSK
ncbi:MAG: hypothetical protein ACLUQK_08535, partial [Clostridium sp.]